MPVVRFRQSSSIRKVLPDHFVPHSLPSSSICSADLPNRVLKLTNRLQVLVLRKPKVAVFLLGLVERFVDSALGS